ncbi:hypothetical protein ABZV76_30545 [Streptomyces tendae]
MAAFDAISVSRLLRFVYFVYFVRYVYVHGAGGASPVGRGDER